LARLLIAQVKWSEGVGERGIACLLFVDRSDVDYVFINGIEINGGIWANGWSRSMEGKEKERQSKPRNGNEH